MGRSKEVREVTIDDREPGALGSANSWTVRVTIEAKRGGWTKMRDLEAHVSEVLE